MKRVTVLAGILATFIISSLTSLAQTPSREEVLEKIKAKRAELVALEKTYLAPAEEDQVQYAAFIRTPNSGLVRLLPRETFDTEAYTDQARAIITRGGGAYFSFTKLTHEYGAASDIQLGQNEFSVGFAGWNHGFLTNLGDVPLETVNAENSLVAIFAAYQPPHEETPVRTEQRRFGLGTQLDNVPVKSRVPVKLNSTYLLRSVTYREADVLVAFRVVRTDSDGSVTILWKLVKKLPAPDANRSQAVVAQ
jgi:hypothetical protein